MKFLVGSKLGRRLLGTFVLLSLPVIAAGWVGIRSATGALKRQTHELLRAASNGAEAQVREFLMSLKRTTESSALEDEIRAVLSSPRDASIDLRDLLKRMQLRVPEVKEVYCMDLHGKVAASSSPQMVGKDESASAEFQQGLKAYNPGDVVRERPTGTIRWKMSAPVKERQSGRMVGVIAVELNPASLSGLTTGKRVLAQGAETQSFRMGETGETYLVNSNGML